MTPDDSPYVLPTGDVAATRIVICRDIPGDHIGGPDCWCCPGVFSVKDESGIEHFLATNRLVS